MSWRGDRRSASSRQCASEPPAMSAPYRWTTKASFTSRSRRAVGRSCAQARRLDGQLLHAGEQHVVDAPLPLEVVAAVLEQPAEHRHQHAALDEDDERRRRRRAVRLVAHRRLEAPGVRIAEQLRAGAGRRASPTSVAAWSSASTSAKSARIVEGAASAPWRSSCSRSRSRTRPCSSAITASTATPSRHRSNSSRTPARTCTLALLARDRPRSSASAGSTIW